MWSLRDCDCTSFMTAYVGCAVLPLAVGIVLVLPVWIAWKVLTEGSTQRRGVMSSLLQRCGCWTSAWVWIWAQQCSQRVESFVPSISIEHSKAHRLSTEQFPGLKVRASWTASSAFEVCIKRFTTHTQDHKGLRFVLISLKGPCGCICCICCSRLSQCCRLSPPALSLCRFPRLQKRQRVDMRQALQVLLVRQARVLLRLLDAASLVSRSNLSTLPVTGDVLNFCWSWNV